MHAHLIPLLEKLANHRILCVGDIMLDKFVYGQVERISPEAPIPVLHIQREDITLGGCGNAVNNISSLGGMVDIIGIVGNDQASQNIADIIATKPQITPHLVTDPSRPTTTKTRFVAENQQMLRADYEANGPISQVMEEQVLKTVQDALKTCEVIILSDYAKGLLTKRVLAEIINLANAKNIPVLVDPKGRDFSLYRGATLLTPNRKELTEATGLKIKSVSDAEAAARKLIAENDLQGVLAKLGGDGVCLVLKDKPAEHFHVTAREVYDVSGAGDTVVATMALSLAGGLSYADSAALANLAGSIVVGKVGTAAVTREDLLHALTHDQASQSESKILPLDKAVEKVERWRKQGLKVGFTNGCFDLLHPGHLSLIRQARAACDRLVLGMNSDASVKRLKGESRPIQNEDARAMVLASLADIDAVVIFGEDTPLNLIKTLRPSILVKGADYTKDKVVGGDIVESYGGQIILANLVEGQSTTSTISRMNIQKG